MNARPLHSSKFCTQHFSSILKLPFKTILPKREMFSDKDDICCIWSKWKVYSSKTTWIVDINNPVNFVNSKIDVCRLFKKFWYSETTFSIFVLFKESSRATELIVRHKSSISCFRVNTDLFQFMTNPKCCRKKKIGSRLMSISWVTNQLHVV